MAYSDVDCPYCEMGQEINHDDGVGYEEGILYTQSCRDCDKIFTYTTSISFYHEANKADCLNGGEHKLKQIHGLPREYFIGKFRCEDCDEEFTKK